MKTLDLTNILSESWKMTKESFSHLVLPVIATAIYIVAYLVYDYAIDAKQAADIVATDIINGVALGIAGSIISVWFMVVALNIVRNSDTVKFSIAKAGWLLLFSYLSTIVTYLVAFIVIFPIIIFALFLGPLGMLFALLLIIAAVCAMIYFSLRLFFFIPELIADTSSNPFALLSKSWALSQNNFWKIIGIMIMISIINLLGLLALVFGLIFTLAWTQVALMHFYNEILQNYKAAEGKSNKTKPR